MADNSKSTTTESFQDPFPAKRGLFDVANGTDTADPNEGKTCEVADCENEAVNTALCGEHAPPRVQPGRICRSCGSLTTETWAVGPPDGGEYPVCSTACLLRLSRRWDA